jgi:putative ABC transport system permease protein
MSATSISHPRARGGAVPLAWRNLVANKRRLVRSSAGLGFAALLMLVQLGFERAFFDASLAVIEQLDGDLFLLNASKYRFGADAPFSRRQLEAAAAVRGVASARPLYADWIHFFWRSPRDDKLYLVQALAFDPDQPVFLLPEVNAARGRLKPIDTVLVDRRSRRFLDMDRATQSELDETTVHVVGSFALGPDFANDGTVVMSDRTFARLKSATAQPQDVEVGVIKLGRGIAVGDVQQALRAALPQNIVVMTKPELIEFERRFQANVSSAGPIFAMGTVVGFIVGMLISYQIVYTDLSDQLPQYATLKGLGYNTRYLVRVVMEQAALSALCGYVPAWLLCVLVYWVIGAIALIPLHMTLALTELSLGLTVGMCVISAALAVHRVIAADPAEIF